MSTVHKTSHDTRSYDIVQRKYGSINQLYLPVKSSFRTLRPGETALIYHKNGFFFW
jgi:hypothetical protein